MAWNLATALQWLSRGEDPARDEAPNDPLIFPAGVVAVGRGGAGEHGALLREDGRYVGLLHLSAGGMVVRTRDDVAALAAALPSASCQIVTVRWPIDAERVERSWQSGAQGSQEVAALGRLLSDSYLPRLLDGGWSEVRTLLAFESPDLDTLQRTLTLTARALPFAARPATMHEAKWLAGDWLAPHCNGQVTIGWGITELAAAPPPNWAQILLESDCLQGIPTVLTLHLGQAGAPVPVSLEVRRRVAWLDAELAAREASSDDDPFSAAEYAALQEERRDLAATLAAASDEERPRPARLVLGCTVEPECARALRAEVEPVLQELGFVVGSLGPGRSRDTHLTCAPLGLVLVGRTLTLSNRGAALLAPLVAKMGAATANPSATRTKLIPLGLQRDGAAMYLPSGGAFLSVGDSAGAQIALLGQLAAGLTATVIDTTGRWEGATASTGREVVSVAANVGALLGDLGTGRMRLSATGVGDPVDRWVTTTTNLFADLCPALDADDLGDLTAHLLTLSEAELAWGEPVQLHDVIVRLRESGSEAAKHLATLLAASGGLRSAPVGPREESLLTVYDAGAERPGLRVLPSRGCGVVALQAVLAQLSGAQRGTRLPEILVLDDLAVLLEAAAGPALLLELIAAVRRCGVALWVGVSSLAACPRPVLAALHDLLPTTIIVPDSAQGLRLTARACGYGANSLVGIAAADEVICVPRDSGIPVPLRLFPLQMPPYVLRDRQERAPTVPIRRSGGASVTA